MFRHRNFEVGTKSEETIYAMASCCVEKMKLTAKDVVGEQVEAYVSYDGSGTGPFGMDSTVFYAIVGSVAAVLLIIVVVVIVVVVRKYKGYSEANH